VEGASGRRCSAAVAGLLHVLLLSLTVAPVAPAQVKLRPPADLVITHARVWTVDKARPRAEAVAIVGQRIAAVGSAAEIAQWVGPETQKVDARGASVLPGFIDAHVHLSTGGFDLSGVQLKDAQSREEFVQRIAAFARTRPKGEWILGGTWDHENWPGAPLPERSWIDAVTPDHPVFVSRYDGHMALANSLALKLAGLTRDTATPAGGSIVRDASGEPTGALKDAARGLVERVIPAPSEEQLTRAIQAGLNEAAKNGLTGIHALVSAEDLRVLNRLHQTGALPVRVFAITPIEQWQAPAMAGITAGFGDDWLRTGAVKGFADGSLGSTTALFYQPYDDAPHTSGLPAGMMFPEGNMLKMALGADRAGLQLRIHAIGDKAIQAILDVYKEVERQNGVKPRRWTIEHAQHMAPGSFADFARLGVTASMQPYHAIDDGRWALKRIGTERGKGTYAFRTFLDGGVRLAFGSDWTVAPLDPLWGIYAAVTRRTLDDKNPGGWYPEQKITVAEAVQAYTMGSASAENSETVKGSITPGKLADLVILDGDIFAAAPERIKDLRVTTTIAGGRITFRKK
jgi:hypothetical protein